MLPGTIFGAGMGSAVDTLTLTYIDEATASGTTITCPSTAQEGDVLIAGTGAMQGTTAPAAAYGTGFTSLCTETVSYTVGEATTGFRTCLSYKIATAGDPGSTLSGFMNGTEEKCVVMVYRPSVAIVTTTPQDITTEGTTGDPAVQTINASDSLLPTISIGLWGAASTGWGDNASGGFIPTADATVGTDVKMKTLAQLPATASNVTSNQNDNNDGNISMSLYLEFSDE